MTSVGDIILGRTVYKEMLQEGWASSFAKVAARLKAADITFGDLEVPLSDSQTPPTEGMSFIAPQKAIEGIILSGYWHSHVANNHSTNFGTRAFTDTINLLKSKNIQYVGGGNNPALKPKTTRLLNLKGTKFAFLDVNTIVGDISATDNSAGDWHLNLDPWGTMDQRQVDKLLAKIREAKKIMIQ